MPTSCFAEESGSLTNSGRWLQWHWKGAEPPGEAKTDVEIMAKLFRDLKASTADGGAFPDPILNLLWPYADSDEPTTDEIAKEVNGSALEDLPDPTDPAKPPILKAGQLLDGFGQLRDDGKTTCGCWIYSGCYTEKGNQMARRDTADPANSGLAPRLGLVMAGQSPHPLQPRLLRRGGQAVQSEAQADRVERHQVGGRRRSGHPAGDSAGGIGPFIMNAEGVRFFARV